MNTKNYGHRRKLPHKKVDKRVKIKIAELFAGVGGFRIGLVGYKGKSALSGYKKRLNAPFEIVFSNQWEPSTKKQTASDIYIKHFGSKGHVCRDIKTISVDEIPDHDLLVAGFPCQDFSGANRQRPHRKKGALWWEIHRIVKGKRAAGQPIKYICLENVDRLIRSPSKHKGRDFAIILASLADLGYAVEWRIINAADYGFPQRRKRIFIMAYHNSTAIYHSIRKRNDQHS